MPAPKQYLILQYENDTMIDATAREISRGPIMQIDVNAWSGCDSKSNIITAIQVQRSHVMVEVESIMYSSMITYSS